MQVDIFKWEVGTEPRGWRPGDNLQVVNQHYRSGPFVKLRLGLLPHYDPRALTLEPLTYEVEFHHAAREKVLVWLRMFANPENYATISQQII